MRFISRCFVPSDFGLSSDHRPVISELNFCTPTTPEIAWQPLLDIRLLNNNDIRETFQQEISSALNESDPETLPSDELASTIRSVVISAAQNAIPAIRKPKFPEEFSAETIALIQRKLKMWKFMQKSGVRVTRSTREQY